VSGNYLFTIIKNNGIGAPGEDSSCLSESLTSYSVELPVHVPIVPMSVKVPVEAMLNIKTSFEPEFVT
jgi:hypothetical protein